MKYLKHTIATLMDFHSNSHADLVLLPRRLVLRGHVQDAVGVDVEAHRKYQEGAR